MELENISINDENSFDPTPKLKSSPIPINFVSFNCRDIYCIYCSGEYLYTLSGNRQKYCKNCLSCYLKNITDNNMYLDVYYTMNLECSEHEIITKEPQVIQECCKNCLDIIFFKQIFEYYIVDENLHENLYNSVVKSEKYCKLCGKPLYGITDYFKFKLCSDCYLISSRYIESTSTKKPIIHLPWWHNISYCTVCDRTLIFTSECQKYCKVCLIFYSGCRYCLTTNIIFGLTTQSQCKKCKRVSSIISSIISGNSELDDFILNLNPGVYNNLRIDDFSDKLKNNDEYFLPSKIESTIRSFCQNYKDTQLKDQSENQMKWISYSQFTNVVEIARGGFGIIYRATQDQQRIILKKFKNSKDTSKYFLNELKSNQNCYEIEHHIIRIHGITKDHNLGDYMLVMQYASEGDLHNWLQKKFAEITWNKEKLIILWQISEGLETIHNADYIHRDFHSGNILIDILLERFSERHQWLIGDLGLSQPANNTSNNEIYGVIPYIAPEIFRGVAFSKKSDIYCMGMIMWELTTGCKPFANVEHDHNLIFKILDGERPEITEDTPECYVNLMKSCWDPDPQKRPSIEEIHKTFSEWFLGKKCNNIFDKAELKRKELIKLEKLGPEFAERPHPKAIYTSRPLSSFISKCSSINSSSSISFYNKQGYNYNSIEQNLDIDIESSRSLTITSKKRTIEESNVEIHDSDNSGKHIKTSSSHSEAL
ncbi:hypothetical protein RclHR1_06440006 [Rhizophagus clarus]|uniref:Kinase-like domain-containing protein n=1 Tax=Rhizophagus clarus TaxID=94130 RepID=A0A2Z6SIV1_9GLOM|nr:hypothetical protein RclHR1_06440006 [Rhizophagus clarus]GES81596.1 kinase-like domain-containing protein [Rhizophagus clarus]